MNFDQIVDRRDTNCVKYDLLVRDGYDPDTIPLWIADMDYPTPECALQAIRDLTNSGCLGYTFPGKDYIAAVQGWFSRRYGWETQPEWIIQTPGVVSALCSAVRAFTAPNDSIMVLKPVYSHFFPPVTDNGRRLVYSQLKLTENGYEIDFDDVTRVMDEEKPKMFILCSPHNPVGRVWTEEELRRIGQLCFDRGILVAADEIHCDFTYPGHSYHPFLSLGPEFERGAIAFTAPSKTFNVAGLGTSNIFIPNPVLRKAFQAERSASGAGSPSALGLAACQAVYEKGEPWLEELLVYLRGNYDAVCQYLAQHIPEIKPCPLEGTYLAWLDARALGMDAKALEDFMGHKARVRFCFGDEYGEGGEGFLRLNLATSRAKILEALERIRTALAQR